MPIFDARLLRELHAQAATVNVSLEGQRAPAIVLARDQTLQRSKLAAASSLRAGCSSSAYVGNSWRFALVGGLRRLEVCAGWRFARNTYMLMQ